MSLHLLVSGRCPIDFCGDPNTQEGVEKIQKRHRIPMPQVRYGPGRSKVKEGSSTNCDDGLRKEGQKI